ncbi:hydantoinase/oxoprolinase family protein [Acrocarpospora catenulata]|uniref:hydantoinase/oxoprolinase family protein n=1 Tax=Acrocarpospora catenulata TaxID=2836182 RepID=UPI001BDB59DD|nr:hydantoinase/oxoprolinase family protein [Acrocarpospora catenulata]
MTGDSNESTKEAFVGVDVGGTHTDVQVVLGGKQARGKALTTYDDFSRGVLEAVGVAGEGLGLSAPELLSQTRMFVNATTVVTNTITQLKGAKVGVLVTKGFKDEFRFAGGPRLRLVDDHLQTNVPDLFERRDVLEIDERIDYQGTTLVELNREQVAAAARQLVESSQVDAIAICFLSSYANPAHEQAAAEIVRSMYPDLFITTSAAVSAVRGEYRRWITTVLNCFVHEHAERFIHTLRAKLREAGLSGAVAFFQGLGGAISGERAEQLPLSLLGAGPAGGAISANELARRMGYKNVLLGDMGGTSFDTGIIYDNEIHIEKAIRINRFRTVLPMVDVVSVGAGGGSIAWISERGGPQVGPQSAGSTPGPAAYGRGGTEPTVTDAMVSIGLVDPDNYLGGRVQLSAELAQGALRKRIAEPMGWSLDEASGAVHDLVVANMATAVREVSVNKGHDPRDFVFLAYGGTLPGFAWQIAAALGISTVVIPDNSPVFCARGVLISDFVLRADRTVESPMLTEEQVQQVNDAARELTADVVAQMREEGFTDDQLEIAHSGDFQYIGQVHALPMSLPEKTKLEDVPRLQERFTELYERTYGPGTAWPTPPQLLNYTVTVTAKVPHPEVAPHPLQPTGIDGMRKADREIYLPDLRERRTVPILDEARFTPGSRVKGPCVIEAVDTTVYVPAGVRATRDEHRNIVMTAR